MVASWSPSVGTCRHVPPIHPAVKWVHSIRTDMVSLLLNSIAHNGSGWWCNACQEVEMVQEFEFMNMEAEETRSRLLYLSLAYKNGTK